MLKRIIYIPLRVQLSGKACLRLVPKVLYTEHHQTNRYSFKKRKEKETSFFVSKQGFSVKLRPGSLIELIRDLPASFSHVL